MKVIVLGGAGMLGHQVWQKCLETFGPENVACTLRKSCGHYSRFRIFERGQVFDGLDVQDFSQVEKVLLQFRPDYIVNGIGLTLRKQELQDITRCYDINSMLPHRLALWGRRHQARVIHISTDCVFDGARGNYSETDVPTADDHYGKSKFLGEVIYDNALTLRLSIVGRELEGKTELLEWFLAQKGKTIKGFSQVHYSGLTTNFVASEIDKLMQIKQPLHGLYQMSSQPITKFELLNLANRIFQVKAEILPHADYVSDKTLSSEKYSKQMGFVRPSWEKMLTEVANDRRVDYGV